MVKALGIVLVLLGCIGISDATYAVSLLLKEFNNGQGFLANGSHCSQYWFSGNQCNIRLSIGVDFNSNNETYIPCQSNSTQMVDLQNVTSNSNSISFGQQTYGAWSNPMIFTQNSTYTGFTLCVLATEATTGELIDQFAADRIDGYRVDDFTYYSHTRQIENSSAYIEPTLIGYAWVVSGDVEYPRPTLPPTTTTTKKTPTGYPIDCEDAYKSGRLTESGPLQIALYQVEDPVEVYCEVKGSTVQTIIQSRGSSSLVGFDTLSFEDFQKSQGTPGPDNDFWLGLDNMNALTMGRSAKYNMSIVVCCQENAISQYYSFVTIGNEASGYLLTGSGGDPSIGLNAGIPKDFGKKFSTEDTNHFGPPQAVCAAATSTFTPKGNIGGWWFGCANNLNGHYYSYDDDVAFSDRETCTLNQNVVTNNTTGLGPGIELNTAALSGNTMDKMLSWKSYTRVRMGLYRADGNGVPTKTDFCKGNK